MEPGRADHPRGHRRQEGGRPRPAHPPQPHLHLGGRRQGRRRRGLRQRRGDGARGDPQPARASLPAGDLRLRRLVQQGHRLPDGLHDDAGAAPGAHRAGDAVGHCRKQDPRRSAATSAAASATRCRSIRATWSPSSRRSSPACRSSGSNRASTTFRPPALRATTTASANWRPTRTAASRACASPRWPTTARSIRTSRPPSCRPACSASAPARYAIPNAYCRVDAVYTNKAPGGVAYRCSLRVTEAVYLIERMIDVLALKLGIDKAEIRRRNFVKAEQFPYTTRVRLDARQRRLPRRRWTRC